MQSLKNYKGFTLIELAIVLVIIGIIIGAVLKGQELIQSARIKKFISEIRKSETAIWTFLDRNGRFPGDGNNNGLIADWLDTDTNPYQDLVTNSKLLSDKDNPIVLGNFRFWISFGVRGIPPNVTDAPLLNVIVICPADNNWCRSFITSEELEFFKAFDAVVDGTADAKNGRVRGGTQAFITKDKWILNSQPSDPGTDWGSNTISLIYYFDHSP